MLARAYTKTFVNRIHIS